MSDVFETPSLTSLAHGGGCGCKLDPAVLSQILGDTQGAALPAALMVDAGTRDDAAVYRLADDLAIVATTDFFMPVVDDPYEFGRIAATNAISDIYAMGAEPIFCLAIVGMPVGKLPPSVIKAILDGGASVAEAAGAPVAGGHSIDSVEPIYGLVALGRGHPDRILTNAGAKPGDVLVLGKPLGVGIFSAALKRGELSEADYADMIASTTRLNAPGADLAKLDGVHAMTDVTGFGLLGHLKEMSEGSGVSVELDRSAIPVFAGARALLEAGVRTGASGRNWAAIRTAVENAERVSEFDRDLYCDPQTSGGLLVSCAPEAVEQVLACFADHGHAGAAIIGRVKTGEPRIHLV